MTVMGLQWAGSAYVFDDNCYGLKKKTKLHIVVVI